MYTRRLHHLIAVVIVCVVVLVFPAVLVIVRLRAARLLRLVGEVGFPHGLELVEMLFLSINQLGLFLLHVRWHIHRARFGERLGVKRYVFSGDAFKHDLVKEVRHLLFEFALLLLRQFPIRFRELCLDLIYRALHFLLHVLVMAVEDGFYGLDVLLNVRCLAYCRGKRFEIFHRSALFIAEFGDLLAIAVKDKHGRESLDFILLRNPLVVLPAMLGQKFLVLRIVDVHEFIRVCRHLSERLGRKDFLFKRLAPVAPVASAEHHDDMPPVPLGTLERRAKIVGETFWRRCRRAGAVRRVFARLRDGDLRSEPLDQSVGYHLGLEGIALEEQRGLLGRRVDNF